MKIVMKNIEKRILVSFFEEIFFDLYHSKAFFPNKIRKDCMLLLPAKQRRRTLNELG
jgi:hypothetical protein